jgi:hypothetical protein
VNGNWSVENRMDTIFLTKLWAVFDEKLKKEYAICQLFVIQSDIKSSSWFGKN